MFGSLFYLICFVVMKDLLGLLAMIKCSICSIASNKKALFCAYVIVMVKDAGHTVIFENTCSDIGVAADPNDHDWRDSYLFSKAF